LRHLFHIVGSFPDISLSQGSVVMRLRCGGIFHNISLRIYCWVWQWKNFENPSTFGEVMGN